MGKEERKQKIEELSKKMKEVNSKIKEGTDTVIVAGMEAKDVLDEKMKDAQSGLEAAKEQCRIATEKGKSKITEIASSDLYSLVTPFTKYSSISGCQFVSKKPSHANISNTLKEMPDCIDLSVILRLIADSLKIRGILLS